MPQEIEGKRWWTMREIARQFELKDHQVINAIHYHEAVSARIIGTHRFIEDRDVKTLVQFIQARVEARALRAAQKKALDATKKRRARQRAA